MSPANILIGYDGSVQLADFGIAKLGHNKRRAETQTGTLKGKVAYMSPEQCVGEAMDRRSDVFSLGVVLHELLTGQGLFDGDSIYAVARAVEHQEIKPPSVILGEPLPIGLDAVVMNALDRNVERRTQTAAQLAEELERVIANAGDETLASWADRELAQPRAAHRTWLASVLAGRDAPLPVGRATGAVTEVGPVASAGSQLGVAPVLGVPPAGATHLPANVDTDSSLDRVPRRSLALPVILALVALLGVIALVVMTRTSSEPQRDAAVPIDLAMAADAPPIDSPVVDAHEIAPPPPADASVDAPARRVPNDAGRVVAKDAAVAAAVIDAAPVQSSGTGILNIRNRPGGVYLNVVIDGRTLGVTPMLNRQLPAGPHTLQLLAPDTGAIVFEKAFELQAGATLSFRQP